MNSRRPRTTSSERAAWVKRYERSGMTQRAFAEQHGLGLSTLQKWLTQAQSAQTAAPMQWQEVKLPSALGTSCWAAEIVQPNGVTLRFSHDASAELVSTLWPLSSC